MGARNNDKLNSIRNYERLLEKQVGKAVRPFRADSYVNLLNKYGTTKDTSEHYHFQQEPPVPDDMLTAYYEGNGLFAKIIDTPAEEAVKHGFEIGTDDQTITDFYTEALDELDWEEKLMTAIKWTRLFGGCIVVMLIDDGRGLDEPLDWQHIKSIDDLCIYDRSLIQEDTSSMFDYRPDDPFRAKGSRLGMPEYYDVFSKYGNFRVHDSRCLVFQNGTLPENTTNSIYQLWGMPEYVRINKAIRDAEVAHGSAIKLLDRSVQAVYRMKDLSAELATAEGEDRVLRRLQTIDMARGLLNSITIDADGEDYGFQTFQFSGVSTVVDSACNYLSALTSIPQTLLFGRSPAGMNSTGESDLENWYNYVERIQSRMIKKNLRYLLSVIFQAGVANGEIDEVPKIKIEFSPLWSMSESEKAAVEQQKAATQQTKAQTAQIYMDAQVIDPTEVRRKLADSGEFDVETMLDEYDEEELFENMPQGEDDDMPMGGEMPPTEQEAEEAEEAEQEAQESGRAGGNTDSADTLPNLNKPSKQGAKRMDNNLSTQHRQTLHSDEGNANSGNYGHEGRPGKIGGSAPSTNLGGLKNGELHSKLKSVFSEAENGTHWTAKMNGVAGKKTLEIHKVSDGYYTRSADGANKLCKSVDDVLDNCGVYVNERTENQVMFKEADITTADANTEQSEKFSHDYDAYKEAKSQLESGNYKITEVTDSVAKDYADTLNNASKKKIAKLAEEDQQFKAVVDNISAYTQGEYVYQRETSEHYQENGYNSADDAILGDRLTNSAYRCKDMYEGQNLSISSASVAEGMANLTKAIDNSSAYDGELYRVAQDRGVWELADSGKQNIYVPPTVGETISIEAPTSFSTSKADVDEIAKNKLGDIIYYTVESGAKAVDVSKLSPYKQHEMLSCGSYEVAEVESTPRAASRDEVSKFTAETLETLKQTRNASVDGDYVSYSLLETKITLRQIGNVQTDSTDQYLAKYRSDDFGERMVFGKYGGNVNSLSTPTQEHGSVGVLVVKDGNILTGTRKEGFKQGQICGPGGHVEDGESVEEAAIRETQEEFGITPTDMVLIGYGPMEKDTGLKPAIFLATEYEGEVANTDGEIGEIAFRDMGEIDALSERLFKPFKDSCELMVEVIGDDIKATKPNDLLTPDDLFREFTKMMPNSEINKPKPTDKPPQPCYNKNIPNNPYRQAFQSLSAEDIAFMMNEFGIDVGVATDDELLEVIVKLREDGGEGSGNFGHKGVEGQRGGSAPSGITKYKTEGGTMKINSNLSVKASKSGKATMMIAEGSEITGVYAFAGKGSNQNLVVSGIMAQQYGGKPADWSHKCGFSTVVDKNGQSYEAEIHWFEHDEIGQVGFKIKKR